jgi:hypothetical protein
LTVFTRDTLPHHWATSQNNLGGTLGDQGVRASGSDALSLLAQAVEAHRAALTVFTRDTLPQDWARTLSALDTLHRFNHEELFDFAAAFKTAELRAQVSPDNALDFAETHFTTGRFDECIDRAKALQQQLDADVDQAASAAAMRVLEILALGGLDRVAEADERLGELIKFVSDQDDGFRLGWTWRGTRHFIETGGQPALAQHRSPMLALLDAVEGEDALVSRLRAIRFQP